MPVIPARALLWLHGIATLSWFLLIIPSVLWWKESIVWIVVMSVWANLASHFSAWQGVRAEIEQQNDSP